MISEKQKSTPTSLMAEMKELYCFDKNSYWSPVAPQLEKYGVEQNQLNHFLTDLGVLDESGILKEDLANNGYFKSHTYLYEIPASNFIVQQVILASNQGRLMLDLLCINRYKTNPIKNN